MKNKSENFLMSLKLRHFILVGVVVSEILVVMFSYLTTALFYDVSEETMSIIYVVGTVDAFFTASLVIWFVVYLKSLYEKNLEITNKNLEDSVNALAVARDDAIESERVSVKANKSKSSFLANMSHELRTPLNIIIGYSEMLIESSKDKELNDFVIDLNKINTSSHHLLSLISSLLDISKIESGKMDLYIEPVNIARVISDISEIISPLAKKNNNQFNYKIDDKLDIVLIDEVKIRQSILNLLSNAFKFTKDGVVSLDVSLEKSDSDNNINFVVSDNGIGMNKEQLDKVFNEFSQADESTTKEFGGTGLGLTISKGFAQMMGGDINVESEYGKGTTFTFYIPGIEYHSKNTAI